MSAKYVTVSLSTSQGCPDQFLSFLCQDLSVSSFFSCVASFCHHRISSPISESTFHTKRSPNIGTPNMDYKYNPPINFCRLTDKNTSRSVKWNDWFS